MRFAANLLNNFDEVYFHHQNRIKELTNFHDLIIRRNNHELEYSNTLIESISSSINSSFDGTLFKALINFDIYFSKQQDLIKNEFIIPVKSDIIKPIKDELLFQSEKGNFLYNKFVKSEKLYHENYEKIDKFRIKYYEASQKFQEKTEAQEGNTNNSKINELKEEVELAGNYYQSQINITNAYRESHLDTTKTILNEFEVLEEKYIEFMKETMRKYNIYLISMMRNLIFELEKQGINIDQIDSKADIDEFLRKKLVKNERYPKAEFIPFVYKQPEKPKSYKQKFFDYAKSFFWNDLKTEEKFENVNETQIKSTLESIWEGNDFPKNQQEKTLLLLKEQKMKKHFFICLNSYRSKGSFSMNDKTFNNLSELLLLILDDINLLKDYESFRNCLILSQTFYKIEENNKIFLNNSLENHVLFKDIDFWEEVIRFSIKDEICKKENSYEQEFSEILRNHQNLVFGQMLTLTCNLISFEKEKVISIIQRLSEEYNLTEEMKEILLLNLENSQNQGIN